MAWLTSIFMLDVLNRVSFFGYSILLMEESSFSGYVLALTSSVQLMWIIVLSSSLSLSSYKVRSIVCHKKFLHLLVLHFPPLIVTTISGAGDTDLFQTVVAVSVCSIPCLNTVAAGSGIVDDVGGYFQTPIGAALQILPC